MLVFLNRHIGFPGRSRNLTFSLLTAFLGLLINSCSHLPGQSTQSIALDEITIEDIHLAYRQKKFTARELTQAYIERIKAYDQSSKLNAIVMINPLALQEADKLDLEFERTAKLRPLHGIPVIIKDNYQTKALQTTAGSLALKGFEPLEDAFQVRKLREAGAIILAKSNMAEWAFSPYVTESSIAGITRNPYDLMRVPAGSSGGTAAAIAANFAVVGLGTDTGNSIRGPSSHTALVGIRSSMGLTSRSGIIPLLMHNDIGGPMARTLEDAVKVLDVIAAYDGEDPVTEKCAISRPDSYLDSLNKDGLNGLRIGVFRHYIDAKEGDSQIKLLTETAVNDLQAAGAEIVDPIVIPNFEKFSGQLWCEAFAFQYDLDTYLAGLGRSAPYKDLQSIVATKQYAPYIEESLQEALASTYAIDQSPPCDDIFNRQLNIDFRSAVVSAMDQLQVDILVYPTWSNPPRKVGDTDSPAGDNSQDISPHTGFPAITVPMGYTQGRLPAGLTFIGKMCGEAQLISAAYAYEQATLHRRPPAGWKPATIKPL